jgi:hypothetical protein
MVSPIESSTLNSSEWPSDAVVSSLSAILETGDLPPRFYLSALACQGILRRSDENNKALPPALRMVLETVAVHGPASRKSPRPSEAEAPTPPATES